MLLGALNLDCTSELFGRDALRDGAADSHAFMANDQTVGFVDGEFLVELRRKQSVRTTRLGGVAVSADEARHAFDEGMAFYQVAARRLSGARRDDAPAP